jgi:thiamine kinase-like enzyme
MAATCIGRARPEKSFVDFACRHRNKNRMTSASPDPRLAPALGRCAHLFGGTPMVLGRLGGLTNANYLVSDGGETFVLRLPGVGTQDYIDRAVEAVAARATAEIGVNAPLLLFDPADGLQVTRFVEGRTMSEAGFKDHGAIARAAVALRTVHTTSKPFAKNFEVFAMISAYLAILTAKNTALPDGYAASLARAEAVRTVLNAATITLAPCHCDPLAENFVDTGSKMHLLDWEYSGNNDPMWDLGDVMIEALFDPAQERIFLEAYFNGAPPAHLHGRVILYKAMCNLLWTLWAMLQVANGNSADDFWAYAVNRLTACQAAMDSDEFAWALGVAG